MRQSLVGAGEGIKKAKKDIDRIGEIGKASIWPSEIKETRKARKNNNSLIPVWENEGGKGKKGWEGGKGGPKADGISRTTKREKGTERGVLTAEGGPRH